MYVSMNRLDIWYYSVVKGFWWTSISRIHGCFIPGKQKEIKVVWLHFSDRFICKGVDISIYVLPTGGRI